MDISEIRTQIKDLLDEKAGSFGENINLSQGDVTEVTDALAGVLETVNPNGPYYPSTPR